MLPRFGIYQRPSHRYPALAVQIGEVASKLSQFDPDIKQDRDVVKGEQVQQGEKITEIATVSIRDFDFMVSIHGTRTVSIQEPSTTPTRELARLPQGKTHWPTGKNPRLDLKSEKNPCVCPGEGH
jgi:hypothetical protein